MKKGSAPICPPTRKFQQLDAMRTSFYIMTQAGLNPYLMNDHMNCMRYCYTSSHVCVFFCVFFVLHPYVIIQYFNRDFFNLYMFVGWTIATSQSLSELNIKGIQAPSMGEFVQFCSLKSELKHIETNRSKQVHKNMMKLPQNIAWIHRSSIIINLLDSNETTDLLASCPPIRHFCWLRPACLSERFVCSLQSHPGVS